MRQNEQMMGWISEQMNDSVTSIIQDEMDAADILTI